MTCSNKHGGYDSYDRNYHGYHGVNKNYRNGYDRVGVGLNVAGAVSPSSTGIGAGVGLSYDRNGYTRDGYNKGAWDHKEYHDMEGYNKNSWKDHKGYHDMEGYDKDYRNNRDGYDKVGLGIGIAGVGAGVGLSYDGYDRDNKLGYTHDNLYHVRHRSPVRHISHRSPVRHTLVSHNPRHSPIRHRSPTRYENLDGRKSIERRMLEAEFASSRVRDRNGRFL